MSRFIVCTLFFCFLSFTASSEKLVFSDYPFPTGPAIVNGKKIIKSRNSEKLTFEEAQKEAVITEETGKLPKKYGSSDSKTGNEQKASSNQTSNIKANNAMIVKQADAKQKIAFHQNKKKSNEIKNIILKQKLISHKRG